MGASAARSLLLAAAGLGLAGSAATGYADGRALPGRGPRNRTSIPQFVSHAPMAYRFDDVLDARECAMIRRLLFDAMIFFNDTARDGSARDGARAFPLGNENRPRYRMQNTEQLSLYFERPPPVMQELYSRLAKLQNIAVSSIEAIYHLYAPGAKPANLHLDNFNKYLFPHRFASSSIFFDDYEDGGTVFPLLLPLEDGGLPESSVAAHTAEVMRWHAEINGSRSDQDPRRDGYAGRRVMAEYEPDAFRRRTLEEARERCRKVGSARDPVMPRRGTAYVWRNYLPNGEDDVRAIHAGCGSTKSLKLLGTFFFRDWPGPFEEHRSFWDPLDMLPNALDEQRRAVEVQQIEAFRHLYLAELYAEQRAAAGQLAGWRAAAWTARRQLRHWKSLMYHKTSDKVLVGVRDMQESGDFTAQSWSKTGSAEDLF